MAEDWDHLRSDDICRGVAVFPLRIRPIDFDELGEIHAVGEGVVDCPDVGREAIGRELKFLR